MSTISLIREIERRVAERLIPALIERGVSYHVRPGLRVACECAVCKAKRSANRLFSFDRSNPVAAEMFYHAAYSTAHSMVEAAKKSEGAFPL